MRSIEEAGFLSEQIKEWIEKYRKEYLSWFDLCEEINKFSYHTSFTIKVHNKYLPELIGATLNVRAMSCFQGVIIMAERGMMNEAKSLLRCLLEFMFAIVAIEKDRTTATQITLEDLHQRKDYLKAYKRYKKDEITHESNPSLGDIERLMQEIEDDIQKENIKKLTKRELAEKAGLVTFYDTAYKYLSSSIHVNVRDLEQYLSVNESKDIKEILWEPNVDEIELVLSTAAESMLYVLGAISKIFELSYGKSWEELSNNFNKLKNEFEASI